MHSPRCYVLGLGLGVLLSFGFSATGGKSTESFAQTATFAPGEEWRLQSDQRALNGLTQFCDFVPLLGVCWAVVRLTWLKLEFSLLSDVCTPCPSIATTVMHTSLMIAHSDRYERPTTTKGTSRRHGESS